MRFDLPTLIRRQTNIRRKQIVLREIVPTATNAGNLYRAAYKPIIEAWERAIERIGAEYARSVPVRDSVVVLHRQSAGQVIEPLLPATINDSLFDLESLLASLGDELSRLVLSITPSLREWAVQTERWHRSRWRGNVLTATGVDISTMLLAGEQPQSVAEAIAWNVSLIKDVSEQTRSRVSSAVFAAFRARLQVRDLAKELSEIVGASRIRARGIAADQLSKLSGALDTERMNEAGLDRWKYRHGGKLHARPWHRARDGKIYSLKTNKQIGGDDDIKAGDAPSEPPWCSCRKQGIIDLS
ncbi:MAG: phage minor head protein [Devosia sp.]|uniref:phage minor head protein n=1 Tax=Devosia sp. TaxID=1871048 RepID=UPI0033931D3E